MKGASVNFGKQGAFLNTGIPGTGLYDRKRLGGDTQRPSRPSGTSGRQADTSPQYHDSKAIESADIAQLTSHNLELLKTVLEDCQKERREITKDIAHAKNRLANAKAVYFILCVLIIGLLVPALRRRIRESKEDLETLEAQLADCKIEVDAVLDELLKPLYENLYGAFQALTKSAIIDDVVAERSTAGLRAAGGASVALMTQNVVFDVADIQMIRSQFQAMHLSNYNGGDLFLYPGYVIMSQGSQSLALLDYRQVNLEIEPSLQVVENPPEDAEIVDETWAFARKDGQPDRRYKDNWKIPVARYARLNFTSPEGLNEAWLISSYAKSEYFYTQFQNWKNALPKLT